MRRFIVSVFVVSLIAICLFLLGDFLAPRIAWNIRYGSTLQEYEKLLSLYLSARRIKELEGKLPLEKWYVLETYTSPQLSSTYYGILKYCSTGSTRDKVQIVAWMNEQGEVERYLLLSKSPKQLHKRLSVRLPMHWVAFSPLAKAYDLEKCCHAALLDIERGDYGMVSYKQNPSLYYDYEATSDLWLYWETDSQGNILARGVHDSP